MVNGQREEQRAVKEEAVALESQSSLHNDSIVNSAEMFVNGMLSVEGVNAAPSLTRSDSERAERSQRDLTDQLQHMCSLLSATVLSGLTRPPRHEGAGLWEKPSHPHCDQRTVHQLFSIPISISDLRTKVSRDWKTFAPAAFFPSEESADTASWTPKSRRSFIFLSVVFLQGGANSLENMLRRNMIKTFKKGITLGTFRKLVSEVS